jgi:hypothetical protein
MTTGRINQVAIFIAPRRSIERLRPHRPSSTGQQRRRRRRQRRRYDSDRGASSARASFYQDTQRSNSRTAGPPISDGNRDVPATTVRLSGPRWRGRDLQDGRVRNELILVRIDRSGSITALFASSVPRRHCCPSCWRPPFHVPASHPDPGASQPGNYDNAFRERAGGIYVTRCGPIGASKQ